MANEVILENYCFQYQVILKFTLELSEDSSEEASRLMDDNLNAAASLAIIKIFPTLTIALDLIADQNVLVQLDFLCHKFKNQTDKGSVSQEVKSFPVLNLSWFQVFNLLLRNALFSS